MELPIFPVTFEEGLLLYEARDMIIYGHSIYTCMALGRAFDILVRGTNNQFYEKYNDVHDGLIKKIESSIKPHDDIDHYLGTRTVITDDEMRAKLRIDWIDKIMILSHPDYQPLTDDTFFQTRIYKHSPQYARPYGIGEYTLITRYRAWKKKILDFYHAEVDKGALDELIPNKE